MTGHSLCCKACWCLCARRWCPPQAIYRTGLPIQVNLMHLGFSVFISMAVISGWNLVVTEREQVDSQDYFELEYELVMQHLWHILSKILVLAFCNLQVIQLKDFACLVSYVELYIWFYFKHTSHSLWICLFGQCTGLEEKWYGKKTFYKCWVICSCLDPSSDAESKFSCMVGWLSTCHVGMATGWISRYLYPIPEIYTYPNLTWYPSGME